MKKWLVLLPFLFLSLLGHSQVVGPGFVDYVTSAPSGACSQGAHQQNVLGSGQIWTCQSGTWTAIGSGSGSVTSIATTAPITGGTITSTGTIACATCMTSTSATLNTISKYTGTTTIGNSLLTDDGTTLTYTGTGGFAAPKFVGSGAASGSVVLGGSSSGTFTLTVPASVTTYSWTTPAADASGPILSNGAGQLSIVTLPASSTQFLNGTGAFSTPAGSNTIFDKSVRVLREDFCGGAVAGTAVAYGENGWVASTSGQVTKLAPVSANDSCIYEIATTTANQNTQKFVLGAAASATTDNMFFNLGGTGTATPWDSYFRFRINSTVDGNITAFVGYLAPATAVNVADIKLEWDNTVSSTKFVFSACAASVCTTALSTVNKDGNFHTVRIHSVLNGTILFSVDGETDVSISSANVPTTNTTAMFVVNNVTSTAIKLLDASMFLFNQTGLTR